MNKFYLLNYNNWTLQPLINAENKHLRFIFVFVLLYKVGLPLLS